MSQKAPLPSLNGHRLKPRKRGKSASVTSDHEVNEVNEVNEDSASRGWPPNELNQNQNQNQINQILLTDDGNDVNGQWDDERTMMDGRQKGMRGWRNFAQLERNFAQLERNFAQLERDFAQLERNFAQLERDFAQLERNFAQLEHEKKQYDPSGFRDSVLEGLNEAGTDLEALSKFLDTSSSKLDYRRYGSNLIEILIAGGLLAPGGLILQDGELFRTKSCLFGMGDTMDMVKAWEQVFIKLERRFKFLEKMHEEEMNKILVYLKGFTREERTCLARITALWLASGQVPPTILPVLINERQVNDGTSLEFLLDTLCVLKQEKGGTAVINVIKRSGMEGRLMDFFPSINQQQTEENFIKTFLARDLPEIVSFRKNQAAQCERNELQRTVRDFIHDDRPAKEVMAEVKEGMIRNPGIQEHDAVVMVWSSVMSAVEWNKKEDLLQDQALRHLKKHAPLLASFSKTSRSELALLNKIQEFCYDNMSFLKTFNKIVLLLYKTDVLSEEVILKWYKDGHSARGWSVFMDQMSKFVEWLEAAEEDHKTCASLAALISVAEWEIHSDFKDQRLGLLEKTTSVLSMALNQTKFLLHEAQRGSNAAHLPEGIYCVSKVIETIELLSQFPSVQLLPNAAQDIWYLLQAILDEPGTLDLCKLVWHSAVRAGQIHLDEGVQAQIFNRHSRFFRQELKHDLQMALHLRLGDAHATVPCSFLLQTIGSCPTLFQELLRYLKELIVVSDCDPNLATTARLLVQTARSKSRHSVQLFPPNLQHLVTLVELVQSHGTSRSVVEKAIFELQALDADRLNMLVWLFPREIRHLLDQSSQLAGRFHTREPFASTLLADI
eukprot:snap_masked-scaffold42_size484952-processed-gene-3.4 protein:Tk06365 transcript:snap_masked-scaffold42_size484952-processed-gene-3.4-mRNA-1 annotation:"extra bases"